MERVAADKSAQQPKKKGLSPSITAFQERGAVVWTGRGKSRKRKSIREKKVPFPYLGGRKRTRVN